MSNSTLSNSTTFFSEISLHGKLTDAQKLSILAHTKQVILQEREHLFKPNATCKEIYFVVEGYLRAYRLIDGKDHTIQLFQPGEFITDLSSLKNLSPARFGIVCRRKAVLLSMNIYTWKQQCDEHAYFNELSNSITHKMLMKAMKMNSLLIGRTTVEYIGILKDLYPGILNIIPQKHLATLLRVTEQSISTAISRCR